MRKEEEEIEDGITTQSCFFEPGLKRQKEKEQQLGNKKGSERFGGGFENKRLWVS